MILHTKIKVGMEREDEKSVDVRGNVSQYLNLIFITPRV